ncbi:DUF115 domain-containing protein [Candidatus Pacearchaeota archaeon]|nr:DUF115 domain-containing protein [Candidatus Pacearchaeota archaeon]
MPIKSSKKRISRILARIFYPLRTQNKGSLLLDFFEKYFYIRFYGGHCHLKPLYLEKNLHTKSKDRFQLYRKRFGNQRCFIIGNGPSLNRLDLTKLQKEVTIGSNGIYLNYENMGFYPTFFTVVNYLIAEQMGNNITQIEESIMVFPSFLYSYFKNCRGEVNFLNADAGFVCSEDVTEWISWQSTVTFFNLQIAFSLGCPEVYLIGVDNEYVQPTGGYDGKIIVQNDIDLNHFSPMYFNRGFKWQQADPDNMAKCYELVYELFINNNRTIMNATSGGKLEVYPRVEYSTLF